MGFVVVRDIGGYAGDRNGQFSMHEKLKVKEAGCIREKYAEQRECTMHDAECRCRRAVVLTAWGAVCRECITM